MKKPIYLSSFCVNFRDFAKLKDFLADFDDFPLGVEFATWWELQPDMPERVDAAIPDFAGVPCTVHSPFYEICTQEGTEERAKGDALFAHCYEQYHALKATSMVIHTNEHFFPIEEGMAFSEKRILEIWETCQKEGIELTVENVGYPHKGNVLFSQEEFIKLFDRLPEGIGALIDTGHAMLNRWDIVKVIETLGSRIRGYHMNNNDGVGDTHYPCFDKRGFYSEAQMEDVIRAAGKYSPDADIIVEYAPGPHITKELMHYECRRVMELWNQKA